MRTGDLEVRVRGGTGFRELDAIELAEFVLAMTKLLNARLVGVKPTYFTFRPVPRKKELPPCDSCT